MIGLLILGITVLGGLLLAVPRRNVPLMPLVMTLAACGGAWLTLTVGGVAGRAALARPAGARARARGVIQTERLVGNRPVAGDVDALAVVVQDLRVIEWLWPRCAGAAGPEQVLARFRAPLGRARLRRVDLPRARER